MKKLVLASNNKHKVKEFKEILNNYEILTLKDINFNYEIEETGKTFKENALIKAKTIHEFLKKENKNYTVISDDSGLCVPSINNEPGVLSARYAGVHGNDQKNREKLIKNLKNKNKDAYFICNIVVYFENETYENFEGKAYGKILEEEKGKKDFGYDCIFFSDELQKTFGEATEEEKNNVSHRKKALEKMIKKLKT